MTDRLAEIIRQEVSTSLNGMEAISEVPTPDRLLNDVVLPPLYREILQSLGTDGDGLPSTDEALRKIRREKGVRAIRW